MNFTGYVFEHSHDNDKIAVFHRENTISYKDLYSLVLTVAGHLEQMDSLQFQDKVAIVADNTIFFIAAYFGIIATGLVPVPLSPEFGEKNFQFVFDSCKITCVFIQQKWIKRFSGFNIPVDVIFTDTTSDGMTDIFTLDHVEGILKDVSEEDDLGVIIFTSGSTGVPKGVMLTHQNLEFNTNSIIEYLELTEDDRIMIVLPFSYCFGTSLLHTHLRIGGQVVINNQFMFPGKVLNEINEKQCTGFAGVPSNYQILLRRSPLKKMHFPSLRYVQQAGGKLNDVYIQELREALPTTKIYIMYGQTEGTARLSYLPPELLDTKLGSIGKGIPGTKIEVLNPKGKPVKPGETGEIIASGGNIMKGYWNDPEETAKVLRNGKLHTGDLATVDNEGYVYVTEREKDIIKSSGYRVSPKEIEEWISTMPDIVEVAVIGIPDEIQGEAPFAYITTTSKSLTTNKIIDYCKHHFPPYKVPKDVEFLQDLPKNTSNKVDKPMLRKINQQKRDGISD